MPISEAASQQRWEGGGYGQQQQADQGKYHADGQGIRHGPAVGMPPDKGLQDGGRHLKRQRQQADLAEVQVERGL